MGSMEEAVARTDVDLQYNFKQPMNGLLAVSFFLCFTIVWRPLYKEEYCTVPVMGY